MVVPDNSSGEFLFNMEDGYTAHGTPLRRVTIAESASRLMIRGYGTKSLSFEFFWPTDISPDTVRQCIWMAGIALNSTTHGVSRGKVKATIIMPDGDKYIASAERRSQLLDGASSPFDEFSELDTYTEGYEDGVAWIQAFDNEDYQTNQLRVKTAGNIAFTDSWVQALIRSTAAEPWLNQNTEGLTTSLQNMIDGERVLSALMF